MVQDARFPSLVFSYTKTKRIVNTNSTTRATIITPTADKRILIVSVNIAFMKASENGLEVYFGTGTNNGTDDTKSIMDVPQAAIGAVFEAWQDRDGRLGDVDEVVSIRGTIAVVNEDVIATISYRETV